jgi:hypothetical protein
MALIITALRRIGRGTLSKLFDGGFSVGLFLWDLSLSLVNLLTFKRRIGRVTPKGQPGEGGIWPEYVPPRQGDSRCSCPALNAMANHGLFHISDRNETLFIRAFSHTMQGSSLATDGTSPSARSLCSSVPPIISLLPSASTSRGTLQRSSIALTQLGASTCQISMSITVSNTTPRSYVSAVAPRSCQPC